MSTRPALSGVDKASRVDKASGDRRVRAVVRYLHVHHQAIAVVAALGAPLGVAGLLVPFRSSFASPAAALVLVAVVVAVATWGNRFSGVLCALGASLWFDFFLTRPYEQLAISHRGDLETAISLLAVGIIVTEVAARGRHHRVVASEEGDQLALLHEVAGLVAAGAAAGVVIDRVCLALIGLLDLRGCSYEPGPGGPRRATIRADGQVAYGAVVWGASTMGLPKQVDLPIESAGRPIGRFVLDPTSGEPISLERRIVAVALAAQVGSALAGASRSTG